MNIFISGGAKCGKSSLAQQLTLQLAGEGKRYYVATMIPSGPEDQERIRLHLEDRAGMGFETLECFRDVRQCLENATRNGAFLVDSVTSLVQNSLFPVERDYAMDLAGAERCGDGLVAFANQVENAVFVSDAICCDGGRYDETTEQYRRALATIDRRLAQICDVVIEVVAGQCIYYKGEELL